MSDSEEQSKSKNLPIKKKKNIFNYVEILVIIKKAKQLI